MNKNKKFNTPIIFIHYGDTPYLQYTLKSAKYFNPNKEVILLGDKKNIKYKKIGIKHFFFKDYDEGKEIDIFKEVCKFIAGEKQTNKEWVNFSFKKWFYLYNFIKKYNIERFWMFDSDTLIISDLSNQENKYSKYDCTEQCNGWCMKGLFNNKKIIKNYIDKINELFQREDYLEEQRKEFETNSDYAFTEMRAYYIYKKESIISAIRLNKKINNETFDECICQAHGMKTEYVNSIKRTIKKLYFKNSNIYEKVEKTGQLVKLNSINMSWVTTSFIEKVYYYRKHGKFPPFYIPLLNKISRIPRFIKTKITKTVK